MDHEMVVREKFAEKYLLNELNTGLRNEFEEHFFDCPECAFDIQAGSVFVDQSKVILAEKKTEISQGATASAVTPSRPRWFAILRPSFVVPVFALLLAVIGYQNLVTYPQLKASNHPHVLPWASVNVGTYGSEGTVITTRPGEGFLLFVRIPPDGSYARYIADLYNPAGKVEWSITIPESTTQDQWPVQIPGANRVAGNYSLAVHGITTAGEIKEIGRASFELQIQK
jgi:hypothetical protein